MVGLNPTYLVGGISDHKQYIFIKNAVRNDRCVAALRKLSS